MAPLRARSLRETWLLARAAGERAGVTRLADISGMGGLRLPVFQAVRPLSRSMTVSLGKGGSALAAKVSAMLEAAEFACAEALPWPGRATPLSDFPGEVRRVWAGDRRALTIDLDPSLPRGWVNGRLLASDQPMPMPWDLLSLDFTRATLEFAASSAGLATGNTRDEALLAALGELLEHDLAARFQGLRPRERRALQIDNGSIAHPKLTRELRRVATCGFTPRLWSVGQDHRIAAIACVLFAPEPMLDGMAPLRGSGCHPDAATAALAALREAVQGRAALVAGARDDFVSAHYTEGRAQARALAAATLAFSEGDLAWTSVPTHPCCTTEAGIGVATDAIARLTPLPIIVFDHPAPAPGLHIVHALAPGLLNLSRHPRAGGGAVQRRAADPIWVPKRRARVVLFAGPSIFGLRLPKELELRPPAVCGDLASLLADPPLAVGLVDGNFGIAPSVWHKEILHLLASGVRVLGAASIGAIRAAELTEAGMEGVGTIFAAYRNGHIERDDAVMLLQAPAEFGFAPLSLPLVDAEHALWALACDASARRRMQRIVRTMGYETRTWQRCLDAYRERTGQDFPIPLAQLTSVPSLKRRDAALLIERLCEVAQNQKGTPACPPPPPTSHYLTMLARTTAAAVLDRESESRGDLVVAMERLTRSNQ